METIHGAELVLLSFPEQNAGDYLGGLLTIATPMEKNWHWLRAEDYANMDEMLLRALDQTELTSMKLHNSFQISLPLFDQEPPTGYIYKRTRNRSSTFCCKGVGRVTWSKG